MFWDHLEQFEDRIALITENGEYISYRALVKEADEIAANLKSRCLVFCVCSNCVESIVGYIGFLRRKIVPVMLGKDIDSSIINKLMEIYHPAYVYLPSENTDKTKTGKKLWNGKEYVLIQLPYRQDYEIADDLVALLTTSGSTGSPKFVRQAAWNFEKDAHALADFLGIQPDDRSITTLPFQFIYGLSMLQAHLYRGAAVVVTEKKPIDKMFWELLRDQKVTSFSGVPFFYEMLIKLRFERVDLPSLRYMTQGGGKLPQEIARKLIQICKEKKQKLIGLYGQTEGCTSMACRPWEFAETKNDSIGYAIKGAGFSLIDDNGNEIERPGIAGELVFRGDRMGLGYASNRFDLGKSDENHGELHTGDIATRDVDGFYYIVGRKKRFLKLFGNRVSLDEVESLLNQQGIPCACIGIDDHMEIYVTDLSKLEIVEEYLKIHTSINSSSFTVIFTEKIPRNEAGKVLYSELEKLHDNKRIQ